jgi:hypothetical protein
VVQFRVFLETSDVGIDVFIVDPNFASGRKFDRNSRVCERVGGIMRRGGAVQAHFVLFSANRMSGALHH